MLDRIYLEITNACNFDCAFCHKTKRKKKFISEEEFDVILSKIEGKSKHLFFHLMGEPTLHPSLPDFIQKAKANGFLPTITTNGSLLKEKGDLILESSPYKVSISLHAPKANPAFSSEDYLSSCVDFAKKAADQGVFVALRLWNLGSGEDNSDILKFLRESFEGKWTDLRGGASQRLATRIFLEWGERFDWPDPSADESSPDADLFCYGMREQIGILADGTVVPCCLDADGNIPLGNIFSSELDDILSSPRAKNMYDGFTRRRAVEELCRKCGYAKRFSKEK